MQKKPHLFNKHYPASAMYVWDIILSTMSMFWFNAGSNSLRYELILSLFSRWRNWGIERISIFQGLKARNGEGRIWTLEVISGVQTLYLYAVMLLRCHRRIRPWKNWNWLNVSSNGMVSLSVWLHSGWEGSTSQSAGWIQGTFLIAHVPGNF